MTAGTGGRAAGEAASVLAGYDYVLPEELIAQEPAKERASARLMLVDRDDGAVIDAAHTRVADLERLLSPGDLLVVNATRVLPARLRGQKSSGGRCEALLLDAAPRTRRGDPRPCWSALVKSSGRVRVGLRLVFRMAGEAASSAPGATGDAADDGDGGEVPDGVRAEIVEIGRGGVVTLAFESDSDPFSVGEAPLPPYIRRPDDAMDAAHREQDLDRYQTVYARAPGAVAAPTAGLHLTDALLRQLAGRGVHCEEVVLHVGLGTFRPLRPEDLQAGRLHAERYELPEKTADAVARTRAAGGRVVAVGTTTTRVLEHCADGSGGVRPGRGETDLFLRPGSPIRVIDGLLTNFHLPGSSLLMLVATLIGREPMLAAYRRAVAERFRFYSYGDAMLILPGLAAGAARPGSH